MSRPRTGNVRERMGARGIVFSLRFTAGGKRQHETLPAGTTREQAERELEFRLADVERGIWRAPEPPPAIELPSDPTFHEFATDWFEDSKGEWRRSTQLDYEWQLTHHLLPFFAQHRLSQITVAEVDRYRQAKVAEGKLSATSINKTLTRLGQVLELAVERELIGRNPAKVGGKRRKVKAVRPRRTYLDGAAQIVALLDAAGRIDARARRNGRIGRRALLATLIFAGPRISELIGFDRRDVDLASGKLDVRSSKTDAGVRVIDVLPVLHDVLDEHMASAPDKRPDAPLFASSAGTRQERNRVRNRILAGAIAEANRQLAEEGRPPLPEGLTLHALRRTFASILVALGNDPSYVMAQMGHTDPAVTLGIYARVMRASDTERAELRELVEGRLLVPIGPSAVCGRSEPVSATRVQKHETPALAGVS